MIEMLVILYKMQEGAACLPELLGQQMSSSVLLLQKQQKNKGIILYLICNYNGHGAQCVFAVYCSILGIGHNENYEAKSKAISFEKDTKIIKAVFVSLLIEVFLRVFMFDRWGYRTVHIV
jgi:hypothetical protein